MLIATAVKNPPGVPFFIKPIPRIVASEVEKSFLTRNLTANFDFLEDQLKTAPGGGPFLCGKQLTGADIMMSFPIIAAAMRMPLKATWPKLGAYVDVLQEQEGYKNAVAKVEEIEGEKFVASL